MKRIRTSRKDVIKNRGKVRVLNAISIGYSTKKLKYGDFFVYEETYTDGSKERRWGRYHGMIKSLDSDIWYILSQTCCIGIPTFSYERWVLAGDVVETIPCDKMPKSIIDFMEGDKNLKFES